MTTFLDGPAQGQTLMLKRSPVFLRVTCQNLQAHEAPNTWDALDQVDDTARADEQIYAYEQVEDLGHVHINRGRHGSGFFRVARYKLLADEQPPDEVLRDNARWRQWCMEEIRRRGGEVDAKTGEIKS